MPGSVATRRAPASAGGDRGEETFVGKTKSAFGRTKATAAGQVRPPGGQFGPWRHPDSARCLPLEDRHAYVGAMFVDSHCHLNYKGLVEDQPGVLARARAAGVSAMLNISTRSDEWDAVLATAEREPDVMASVGIHPHEADLHPDVATETLVARAAHPKVVGIGESGLDYYYDRSDRARQRQSFRAHVAAARETGLPLIVHTRDAEDDTYQILSEEMEKGTYPALIHCFTAGRDFADKVLALGLSISISGIVTFKNARDLHDVAREIPADRLLIETDSPFLAPVPHRGRPCEPAFVADTARFLAQLRGESVEQLATTTTANFYRLFNKARRP